MDVLSDVLRVIRLKGSLFLNGEFCAPWCVSAPSAAEMAAMLSSGYERMAICHIVIEGRCWAQIPGDNPVPLAAGDAVVLPCGDAHLLGSGARNAPPALRYAVALKLPELRLTRYGGDGPSTRVVCGWFGYESDVANPAIPALPRLFRVDIRNRPAGAWLEGLIRYAVSEAASPPPGFAVLADRLAEVLFVEALRGYIELLPEDENGWLGALRDPLVGRCVALLHERPSHDWTVSELARAVSASRTVLAERFTAQVGVPPMQYLAQWRMALAANLLRDNRMSLGRVARQVGYESGAGFNRAFKRGCGLPPGAWRKMNDRAHLSGPPAEGGTHVGR